ncbi:uncharacterized protein LOC135702657 [Ochlerotatus camptorhynchus]|uniref:uncharacterized protein LOC135702657 n=1 Tax=Ochlerotatus camptorhynchus TaxID=644619 RepID=UPI0031D799D8
MEGIQLLFYLLLLVSTIVAEENCPISNDELSKIGEILTHIDKPIYKEEQDVHSNSDECAHLLNSIHIQLRRLTQKYKLMNKGYVKVEEFQKMAQEYDRQLLELNKELDQFKKQAQGSAENRVNELKKNIKTLEQNVNKLNKDIKGVTAEYEKVQKTLCITYLESNQISKAKDKVKKVNSKYLIEIIQQFLSIRNGSVLPVIDFSSAIPDLDDRGEAYKTIYSFIESKNRLGADDSLLLEAEIQKMNATLEPGSKITDDRKNEIQSVLQNLSIYSEKTFIKWTGDLNQSINLAVIKNAVDRLFLTQMKNLGEKIGFRKDFNSVRNLLKLLALSNNRYKIAAYRTLIDKKVGHAFGMIWFDMISMDYAELKADPHVSGLFNETYDLLPDSLKKLSSCKDNVNIYHSQEQKPDQCIVTTQNTVEVKHPKLKTTLGRLNQVIARSTGCTRFRLEFTNDKASVRIVSAEGNALTNINTAVPGNVWFSQVGAPYINMNGAKLASSQDWILEANHNNDTIKIESEFNAYQMGKSIDHLLLNSTGQVPFVVIGRYGFLGLKMNGVQQLVEWKFDCAAQ